MYATVLLTVGVVLGAERVTTLLETLILTVAGGFLAASTVGFLVRAQRRPAHKALAEGSRS